MKRIGRLVSFFGLLFGFALMAQEAASHSVAEQYLFEKANAERVQRGLPMLRWNETLYRAATAHADEMAARESISHQYPGENELTIRVRQVGERFSQVAENVAEASTAVRIHDAWMNSPGHRENLLDPKLDTIAISVVRRSGQLYAVQDFDRSVEDLPFEDQERSVASLVANAARIDLVVDSSDARRTCGMDTGYAGARRPWFVMRFTAPDLAQLPDGLVEKLASGKYRQAAVGACLLSDQQPFTAYKIAVLLYR